MSAELARQIKDRASAEAYRATAMAGGMRGLKQDGIEKVLQGLTDMQHVRAACS
jgi:type II secretory ATPase GspE/PulE/Tfp pilus assembly ATPase PilB-like protein